MQNHLHSELELTGDQVVQVTLAGTAANVFLLDEENYDHYRKDAAYQHIAGGYVTSSPVILRPPSAGRWHLVVDLGGDGGQVNAAVTVRPAPPSADSAPVAPIAPVTPVTPATSS